jgi:sugar lactone lactonase YvrE
MLGEHYLNKEHLMTQPEIVADPPCDLGENPLWHPLEGRLYWTDITRGRLYRHDPATGSHEQCYQGEQVGGFTIQADGDLLLFMTGGHIAKWRQGRLEDVVESIPAEWEGRFNDVIADPAGRVFCGAVSLPVGERPGRLYRLDTDGSLQVVVEGIGVSNGMGFTPDRRHMYYTDSAAGCIYRFDYDEASGALANQRVWLQVPPDQGVPDGMTVDAQGHVWSAHWDGSALYRYTPEGVEVQRIPFPARKVSSAIFGGIDLSDMYVTTALSGGERAEEGPGAGALFRLRLGIRGLPEFYSRVKI